ncbi:MAG: sugar phosphate isomerase/epimerase [Rhodospirillales bacterium]|nr:sugar phosphate isomerase/epimerase [Rhodospirillales bacterium]
MNDQNTRTGGNAPDFGFCTWIFGDLPLPEIAEKASSLRFPDLELLGDVDGIDPATARDLFSDHGISVRSLTPMDADIAHPDGGIREKALDYYRRLADFAAKIGSPIFACHGLVGRIASLSSQEEENDLLIDSVDRIAGFAEDVGVSVVFEVLNRYESHQINTCAQGLDLISKVGRQNLSLLLDAYHMNIEEASPDGAIRQAGDHLGLYHAADSHRGAVGSGHTDFAGQVEALKAINYDGPIILELTASGPNPFTPVKRGDYRATVTDMLDQSRDALIRLWAE